MPRAKVYAPFKEGAISFGYSSWQVTNYIVNGLSREDPRLEEMMQVFGLTLKKPAKEIEPAPEPPPADEVGPLEEVRYADFGTD